MVRRRNRGLNSFGYALRGLYYALRSQRHMKIHVSSSLVALLLAVYFHISSVEWLFIIVAIVGVLVAELVNTAIELNVDLVTKKLRPRAMIAKDVAAGAVFIAALGAAVIGFIIFGGRVWTLLLNIKQIL